MNLTPKQNEIITLISSKQRELNKKLYVVYLNGLNKTILADIKMSDEKFLVNEVAKLNTKIVYNLLDKNILVEELINNRKFVTLSSNYIN